ncbi:hypothetical protein L9F63_014509 [Diploptera punctata]|uniref:CRAL-TRIO domain-containing protein n=1 Tax=Diploptera punctata TaxID=6984 RepID=A0AAD8A7Q5_DIPPU|nr:hypothetical protein L9F63_014509 [Diploptera punctata]
MDIRPLSPELLEVAKRDLNEDPDRRKEDLNYIKEWLSKQPHLRPRTDPQWLLTFLRGCKFSLERTKEKLDNYYTFKSALPELFRDRDPMRPELQEIIKLGFLIPLPEPDDQGRVVILGRQVSEDPDKIKLTEMFKYNLMLTDYLMSHDDRALVYGTVSIMDHSKSTLGHMKHFSPSLMKKLATVFQDGYPIRPKALHHVNMPSSFMTIFNLFRTFMKEKINKRTHLHENVDSLCQQVPRRILPKEYGGDAGPISDLIEDWRKKLEAHRGWYLEDEKYGCDEKKRPGKPKTHEDLFGLEGSFRQLNVD